MWELLSMSDVSVVAPDAGSHDRAYAFFNKCANDRGDSNFIQCSKTRSENGSPITCLPEADYKKKCVIVDDIIDGGRTFSDLATKLRAKGATSVELVVTHGIFSYGFDIPGIDKIYTTDTYLENDPAIDPKNKHIVYYKEMY
jgi:ribose-phosphate pyrophosphokinase